MWPKTTLLPGWPRTPKGGHLLGHHCPSPPCSPADLFLGGLKAEPAFQCLQDPGRGCEWAQVAWGEAMAGGDGLQ